MTRAGRIASFLMILALLSGQAGGWCLFHHHDSVSHAEHAGHDHHHGMPQQSHCSRSFTDCNGSSQPSLSPSVPADVEPGLILPVRITTAVVHYSQSSTRSPSSWLIPLREPENHR